MKIGAGVADLVDPRVGVGEGQLEVLRRDAVGDPAGLGQVAHVDQRAAVLQRGGDGRRGAACSAAGARCSA